MRLPLLVVSAALLVACVTPPPPAPSPPPAPPTYPEPPLLEDTRTDPLAAPPDVGGMPADALVTEGGLGSKLLRRGTGTVRPGTFAVVRVHYSGWTTDGRLFDSSLARGKPSEFPLSGVIQGWRLGLRQMVAGEKRRLWIPESLAYKGQPNGPQGMLVFDVELLDVVSN
jgi:peptidylprolyl isomerase